jgi:hypothetical protein
MFRAIALVLLLTTILAAADSAAPVKSPLPSSASAASAARPDPAVPVIQSPVGFIKGYTWGYNSTRGDYLGKPAEESMKALAETGVNWITLAYMAHMPASNKPEILWGEKDPKMVSDDEIRLAIKMARQYKLKVCLKPMVDPADKPRLDIDFKTPDGKTDEAAWQKWWTAYDAYILHHAKIAQETKCEMLCIGCELKTTEQFEKEWRGLIKKIREVYQGPLVYNALMNNLWDNKWWDAVDVLGISLYSWHPEQPDSSVEAQVAYWTKWRTGLRALAAKTGKPIFFIEIGCRSARGAAATSGDYMHWEWPYDGQEQARFYEAAFQVFWNEPWFCGYSWWDWKPKLYKKEEADQNKEFVIYGKPAEQVLRTWYAKERK